MKKFIERFSFPIGLLGVTWYCLFLRPEGPFLGYFEDFCTDLIRQLMAENLLKYGRPHFLTDSVMTPNQNYFPFMAWPMERDWLGGIAWNLNKNFPFLWAYACASLVVAYLGSGFILKKMKIPFAWLLSMGIVVFHIPRHFHAWYHFEVFPQHWTYWAFLLDGWIWRRFVREKKWSWVLEIWRLWILIGTFGITGYYWGSCLLEWMLVRGFIAYGLYKEKRKIKTIKIEGNRREAIFPLSLCLLWLIPVSLWVIPLAKEVLKAGSVKQSAGWFAHLGFFIRPLWLQSLLSLPLFSDDIRRYFDSVDKPETPVSVGWVYLIPLVLGCWAIRKKAGGRGILVIAPFVALFIIAFLYSTHAFPTFFILLVQSTVPFMKFFRAASRWGLLLPQLYTTMIVLCLPELQALCSRIWKKWSPLSRKVISSSFLVLSLVELSWIHTPIKTMPAIPEPVRSLFEEVRVQPGTTVLDLPFCVVGGNWVCGAVECPFFPWSTVPACLRVYHEKKVYGFAASRMVWADCQLYCRAPYDTWFTVWNGNQCFSKKEWTQFCDYLSEHSELSAIFVYPDLWSAILEPHCAQEFEEHLGKPLREVWLPIGKEAERPTRIRWYPPACRK